METLIETPHRLRHFARDKNGDLYTEGNSIFISADRHGVLKLRFESIDWTPDSERGEASPLAKRGKEIYRRECISCHNINPGRSGNIGPALVGSSQYLLRKKLIHGAYPFYYNPQRSTNIMPRFPHLKEEIEALSEYLK